MTFKFCKTLLPLLVLAALGAMVGACNSDDNDSSKKDYTDWQKFNENWLIEQVARLNDDGTPFYTRCQMPTDPQAYVYMHTIGDVHSENLQPLYTSTTKVNYTLTLANDSVVDKGTNFVSMLSSSSLITGWGIAIMQLHVGDSAQFVLPYSVGYGATGSSMVKPYSNLRFNIRLVDIPGYEIR